MPAPPRAPQTPPATAKSAASALRYRGLSLDCASVALLALLTGVLFGPILIGARSLYYGDLTLYFQPLLAFQRAALRHGVFPLWNPTILCGTPFVGNPQAWPLYPSSLLLFAFPAERMIALTGAAHIFLAALGTLLFLRIRGLGRPAALFGAIAWAFGGALVSKLQFPNMVQAAAYLPWILCGIERLAKGPKAASVALLGLLVGLALLAAHPQMTLMQAYVAAAWTLWRARQLPGGAPAARRFVLLAASGALLGALLAAGQLLPVVELTRGSVRAGLTLPLANRFILPPYAAFYNFVSPNFYGNPATSADYVARGNFWEPCAYFGLLAFALAIGAIFHLFRRVPEVRFWTVLAVAGVWLALGRDSGLYTLAFRFLPGVAKFHDPARFLHPATFALACLAAYSLDALLRSRPPGCGKTRTVLLFALALQCVDQCRFDSTLNPTVSGDHFPTRTAAGAGPRLYCADERFLWSRFISYRTYSIDSGDRATEFIDSCGPNSAVSQGYSLVNGYEPVRAGITDQALQTFTNATGSDLHRLARDFGAAAIVRLDHRTNRPVFQQLDGAPGRAHTESGGALPLQDQSPDSVQIVTRTRVGEHMVLSDTLYPGWVAQSDSGKPLVMSPLDGVFRRVSVPRGAAAVTFRYIPTSWRLGWFISLVSVGILIASAVRGAALSRPSARRS